MGNLIPGEALIYERANNVVYARYRDPPYNSIPRWVIGGDPASVNRAQGNLFSYGEWLDMVTAAQSHPGLKDLLSQAVTMYYLVKDNDNHDNDSVL